jgi:hypothetical protein
MWQQYLSGRVGIKKQQNSKGVGNLKMTRVDSTGNGWQRLVREKMEVILGLRERCWQTLGGRGRYEGSLS